MRLPSFNDLIPEQRNIFLANPDDSMLIVGPPGSGKTSIALWKANILSGPDLRRRVQVVTRNRMLSALATQISQDQGNAPVTSATMATYLTSDYGRRFSRFAPQWSPFNYIWEQILREYEAANVQPSIDHLIVDEGQNLPLPFFIWARRFMARAVSVFADEDQSTEVNGTRVDQLEQAGFTDVHPLTVNHRNTQEVANLVEHFHTNRRLPPLPASRGFSGVAPRILQVATWPALAEAVARRWRNRGDALGVILYEVDDIKRLHGLISALLPDARVDFYTNDAVPGAEAAIRMRDRGVTIISGESAIGLEFETVFLQDLRRSLPSDADLKNRRLYMLCARARDTLVLVDGPVALDGAQLADLPNPPILER